MNQSSVTNLEPVNSARVVEQPTASRLRPQHGALDPEYGAPDRALFAIRNTLRPDLQAIIDQVATRHAPLVARYQVVTRLALQLLNARGGNPESYAVGLATGMLLNRCEPDYAAEALDEWLGADGLTESIEDDMERLKLSCPPIAAEPVRLRVPPGMVAECRSCRGWYTSARGRDQHVRDCHPEVAPC